VSGWDATKAKSTADYFRRLSKRKQSVCPDCSCRGCADCTCILDHAERDRQEMAASQLETAGEEVERLNRHVASQSKLLQANADVYNATRRAHEANMDLLAAMTRERDSLAAEVERLRASDEASRRTARTFQDERDQLRRDYLDVADAVMPSSTGPTQVADEARRLRRANHADGAQLDAISDALHRAGVGDAPQLVDRIALAGEELHKLRREVTERDGLRAEVEKLKAMRFPPNSILLRETVARCDSLRRQLEAAGADNRKVSLVVADLHDQLEAARAEVAHPCIHNPCSRCIEYESVMGRRSDRTHFGEVSALVVARRDLATVQQQLETAQREKAEAITDLVTADRRLKAEEGIRESHIEASTRTIAGLTADLAAAQQQIAELEAEAVEADEHWAKRLDELEAENARLTAVIRAIALVYRVAVAWEMSPFDVGKSDQFVVAVTTARAALTPELLAVIEAVGK
jgi:hypothetical protein